MTNDQFQMITFQPMSSKPFSSAGTLSLPLGWQRLARLSYLPSAQLHRSGLALRHSSFVIP